MRLASGSQTATNLEKKVDWIEAQRLIVAAFSCDLQKMLRKIASMRRALHVKGDVMCTMLLLVLFCLLLYARQVRLKSLRIEDKFTFLKKKITSPSNLTAVPITLASPDGPLR